MRIYLAATYLFGLAKGDKQYVKLYENEVPVVDGMDNLLESYHYIDNQRIVNKIRASGKRIFLDSGAFSAYTLGVNLDLESYCRYIQENADIIAVEDGAVMASVLDGIGDPLLTYQNQIRMEQLGVRPLPCFHYGEDERYLEWYMQNYDYVTIGGLVRKGSKQQKIWLDRIFEKYVLDGAGRPKVKLHGFGVTTEEIMERYPWFSVDSSTWIQTTSFGGVSLPGFGVLDVSGTSPSRHDFGRHYISLSDLEKNYVNELLNKNGFKLEDMTDRYLGRAVANIWYYQFREKQINEKTGHTPLPMELF